jgi:hypothetical protein
MMTSIGTARQAWRDWVRRGMTTMGMALLGWAGAVDGSLARAARSCLEIAS